MRPPRIVLASLLLWALLAPGASFAQQSARYGEVLAARLQAQQEMGNWLSRVLTDIAYPHHVIVTVEIGLQGQLREIVDKETRPPVDLKLGVKKKVKLPGLPTTDKNVGAPGMSVKMPGASRTKIEHRLDTLVDRIAVRVFVDENMPDERVDEIMQLAGALAGIEADRGDTLEVVKVAGLPTTQQRAAAGFPVWIALVACGTLLVCAIAIAAALARRTGGGSTRLIGELAAAGIGPGVAAHEAEDDADQEDASRDGANGVPAQPEAFQFLAGATDRELVEVLTRVEPETAAIVLDQVPVSPDVQGRLLEQLPEDGQLELATALGSERVIPTTKLTELEHEVEDMLTVVRSRRTVGSHDRLAALLEQAPEASRDRLLEKLADRAPDLGAAVRKHMLVFEDLEQLPPEQIRQLVAEVDPGITARALQGAPDGMRSAVLEAVSRRVRAILSAEEDSLPERERTEAAVLAARRAMENAMRRIQREGRA